VLAAAPQPMERTRPNTAACRPRRAGTRRAIRANAAALAAVPAAGGAQITFTLSAPATVEVRALNIAGRPVRTVTPGRTCDAGANRLLWSGLSDRGLRVPDGAYLIEVRARSGSGEQSRALSRVQLTR